jgi:hypothetical protein
MKTKNIKMYSRTAVRLCGHCYCLLVLLLAFAGCRKDDSNPEVEESVVVGKWEVQDANAAYGSFEFTSDKKYIITQRNTMPPNGQSAGVKMSSTKLDTQPVYTQWATSLLHGQSTSVKTAHLNTASQTDYVTVISGDYSVLSNNNGTINLNLLNFGTISITINSNAQEATITVTVNGETETYTADKAAEMPTNDKTELFCHTWTFSNYEIIESLVSEEREQEYIERYGNDWKAQIEQEENAYYEGMIATFTKAGTYFTHIPKGHGRDLAYWEWENLSEGIIKWSDGWGIGGEVTVTELTSTTLKILERDYTYDLVR